MLVSAQGRGHARDARVSNRRCAGGAATHHGGELILHYSIVSRTKEQLTALDDDLDAVYVPHHLLG